MRGIASVMISSLYNTRSVNPPEVEINPPKMVCGCSCGRVTKTGHIHNHFPLRDASVKVQLHILGDLQRVNSSGEHDNN